MSDLAASADARRGAAGCGLDILHLDMDCFFAAVEVLLDPGLAGRPVVVGGTGPRGVVASASYEARARGICSAMPTAVAKGLCPQAAFLPGSFARYAEVSRCLRELLTTVTPLVEPVALDEAYLDVSGSHGLLGPSVEIAHALRGRVRDELGLECAVGVGRTKLVAKLASKAAKPVAGPSGVVPGAGVLVVHEAAEQEFLGRHPARALPGVGARTAERLARFGISSVADLAVVSRESLVRLLGASAGRHLHELASGQDQRRVEPVREVRSLGHEETFATDVRDADELERHVRVTAGGVASRCRNAGVMARTVTLKVRYADFSTVTRSLTLRAPVASSSLFAEVAAALLRELGPVRGVRLVGVHASGLVVDGGGGSRQLQLFDASGFDPSGFGSGWTVERRSEVETVTEAIRGRYGARAIGPAAAVLVPGAAPASVDEGRRA